MGVVSPNGGLRLVVEDPKTDGLHLKVARLVGGEDKGTGRRGSVQDVPKLDRRVTVTSSPEPSSLMVTRVVGAAALARR